MTARSHPVPYTPPATLYWRALRRVERRASLTRAHPCQAHASLLAQACRTTNRLFVIAYGWR